MRIIFIALLIQLGTSCFAQNVKTQGIIHLGIPYDTICLKNGSKLIYSTTEKFRIIRLISPTVDTAIISFSIKSPKSAIGWLKADFDNYFILYHDQEGFNMDICNKETGKTIAFVSVIEFDTIKNIICYADWNSPSIINLFDITNSKFEKYISPSVPCLHWWYCIKILEITEKELTLQYTGKNNIKIKKKYVR